LIIKGLAWPSVNPQAGSGVVRPLGARANRALFFLL